MTENERKRLEKIAEKLTGETIIVRVRETYHVDALGDITRVGTKAACITLNPKLDFEQAYRTLLHECSHVLLGHHKRMVPNGYILQPSGKRINYKHYDTGATGAREDKTNLLVIQMDHMAARLSWGVFGGESLEKKLIMFEKYGSWISKKSLQLIEDKK